MKFNINTSLQVLQRTPEVLHAMLKGLSPEWIEHNEGPGTWNVTEVVTHLLYCDTNNWLARTKHILKEGQNNTMPAFDRLPQFELFKNRSLDQLLEEFKYTRESVLKEIQAVELRPHDLAAKGLHPEFGEVLLSQLLSAWVVHDLSHLSQVSRIMAKQYKVEVGPWIKYLRILN